jgi:hypothetical protein
MSEYQLDERVHAFICDDYARYYFVEYSSLRQVNAIAKRLDAQLSNIKMHVTPLVVSDAIRYMVALKKY